MQPMPGQNVMSPSQPGATVTPLHLLQEQPQFVDCQMCHKRAKTKVVTSGEGMQLYVPYASESELESKPWRGREVKRGRGVGRESERERESMSCAESLLTLIPPASPEPSSASSASASPRCPAACTGSRRRPGTAPSATPRLPTRRTTPPSRSPRPPTSPTCPPCTPTDPSPGLEVLPRTSRRTSSRSRTSSSLPSRRLPRHEASTRD